MNTNLLKETIEFLENFDKTISDIKYISTGEKCINTNISDFINIDYENDVRNEDYRFIREMCLVGDDWWATRVKHIWVNFYEWEYHSMPKYKIPSPKNQEEFENDFKNRRGDENIFRKNNKSINDIKFIELPNDNGCIEINESNKDALYRLIGSLYSLHGLKLVADDFYIRNNHEDDFCGCEEVFWSFHEKPKCIN